MRHIVEGVLNDGLDHSHYGLHFIDDKTIVIDYKGHKILKSSYLYQIESHWIKTSEEMIIRIIKDKFIEHLKRY